MDSGGQCSASLSSCFPLVRVSPGCALRTSFLAGGSPVSFWGCPRTLGAGQMVPLRWVNEWASSGEKSGDLQLLAWDSSRSASGSSPPAWVQHPSRPRVVQGVLGEPFQSHTQYVSALALWLKETSVDKNFWLLHFSGRKTRKNQQRSRWVHLVFPRSCIKVTMTFTVGIWCMQVNLASFLSCIHDWCLE